MVTYVEDSLMQNNLIKNKSNTKKCDRTGRENRMHSSNLIRPQNSPPVHHDAALIKE